MSLVKRNLAINITNTQQAFNCPKSTTVTPEQGANYAQTLEHTPHAAPASPLSTPNMQLPAGYLQLKLIFKTLLKFHTTAIYQEMISWKNFLSTVLLM